MAGLTLFTRDFDLRSRFLPFGNASELAFRSLTRNLVNTFLMAAAFKLGGEVLVHNLAGGILIDEAHRHQGYASSALSLCLDYLFKDLMLHQVYCVIDEKNIESQKLFEGQGFVLCGRRKDWIKTAEGFIDELEYQKL